MSAHDDWLDPDRHLNYAGCEEIEEKPPIHWAIRKLVRGRAGDYGLYEFYRITYKYTDCGPSIGFLVDGEWHYCDSLFKFYNVICEELKAEGEKPNTPRFSTLFSRRFWQRHCVTAISVSSIVEGSDAEVAGSVLDTVPDNKPFEQWFEEQLKEVNDEASFLWQRDNSIHFKLYKPGDGPVIFGTWESWDEPRLHESPEELGEAYPSEAVIALLPSVMEEWCHNTEEPPVEVAEGWMVEAYECCY